MRYKITARSMFKLAVAIVAIALAIFLARYISNNDAALVFVEQYGYIALLAIAVVSGFNVFVPVPAAVFIPTVVAAGLNPWLSIAIVSLGMTAGDAVGVLLGQAGRNLVSEEKRDASIARIKAVSERYPVGPLALMSLYASFVPLSNELMVIPLSFMGYSWWRILLAVAIGNTIFNIAIFYGALGIIGL